jgi:hypothetical protein
MYNQQLMPQPQPNTEQEELRSERRAARAQRRKQRKRANVMLYGTIGSTVLLLALMGFIYLQIQNMVNINTLYPPINNVRCDTAQQTAYHIHIHLSIYINGKSVTIPQGIGIGAGNRCYYWTHTHTSDGIIHIEAPSKADILGLDDFLAIWHERFSNLNFPPQLTQQTGWSVYIDGKLLSGITSPMTMPVEFSSHMAITLEYGTHNPPPDKSYNFPPNLPT